jgi:hypothetical protein
MLLLPRLSFGVGDRFAHQAAPQLEAFERLATEGVVVAPVWNKSHREHSFVGSRPESVRAAAADAVAARRWPHPWFVDADHVRLETVDGYLDTADFFTIDVAESIGRPATAADVAAFAAGHPELAAPVVVPGLAEPLDLDADALAATRGPAPGWPPPSGTCPGTPTSTRTCGSSCTCRSSWRPGKALGTPTCSSRTATSSAGR